MPATAPKPGDYVVEYRPPWRGHTPSRVAVVHLTPDAGPEELFSSDAVRSGERAESLATLWALEDGTSAWRIVRSGLGGDTPEPIGINGRVRETIVPLALAPPD